MAEVALVEKQVHAMEVVALEIVALAVRAEQKQEVAADAVKLD